MDIEYKCQYCGKICKNANSLRNHERLCKSNPNRQTNPQKGKTPWNKGLTKETDSRLMKMSRFYYKKFEPYHCETCGKLVTEPYGSNKYCSVECANKRTISQEQKSKISQTMCKVWAQRKNNGKKINKIKEKLKKPLCILNLSKRTISKILKRANQGCMECGWNESTCDIHHIIPKKQGGTDENKNLIVICPNCHRKVHTHKLILNPEKNIENLFSNWTSYYYVDLEELDKLIEENK